LQKLSDTSPFLSSKIIGATIDLMNDKFSESEVLNILLLNPEALGSQGLYRKVFMETDWTNENLNELSYHLTQITERGELLKSIAILDQEITKIRRLKTKELINEEKFDHLALDQWLELDKNYNNDLRRVQNLFSVGLFNAGIEILNDMIHYNTSVENNLEHEQMISLKSLERDLNSDYEQYISLEVFELDLLYTISELFDRKASYQAASVLNYFYDHDLRGDEKYYSQDGDSGQQFRKEQLVNDEQPPILFPNPTKGILNINLKNISSETNIMIYDLNGYLVRELKSQGNEILQLNTFEFNAGIYNISIRPLKGKAINEKLVIL